MGFFLGHKFNGSIFVDIRGKREVIKVNLKVTQGSGRRLVVRVLDSGL